MEKLLIQGGRVVDPAQQLDAVQDVLVADGKVSAVGTHIVAEDAQVIDATGKVVMPGFIDLHVHLRDPGFTEKETLQTGAAAAAAGGVTTICPMPNTKPVMDTPERIRDFVHRAAEAPVHILPIGAVTLGQEGKTLVDMAGMKAAGAVAFSEDGKSVMDSLLFRKALQTLADLHLPMFSHCEDKPLVDGGVMNAGAKAEALGLPGITNAVEDVIVARDIFLAKETGCRLHLCHCSTADSVRLVQLAKEQGLPVTAEVCPHHFTLSDADITEDHGRFKMNPPLRSKEDVAMLQDGLKQGIMDVIATDHAPHTAEEKNRSMKEAPFGIVGLETSFALSYTELVRGGVLSLSALVEKMSLHPAQVLGIDKGTLAPGSGADMVIARIDTPYEIHSETFHSKGKNMPYEGRTVYGRIETTIVDGVVVYGQKLGK